MITRSQAKRKLSDVSDTDAKKARVVKAESPTIVMPTSILFGNERRDLSKHKESFTLAFAERGRFSYHVQCTFTVPIQQTVPLDGVLTLEPCQLLPATVLTVVFSTAIAAAEHVLDNKTFGTIKLSWRATARPASIGRIVSALESRGFTMCGQDTVVFKRTGAPKTDKLFELCNTHNANIFAAFTCASPSEQIPRFNVRVNNLTVTTMAATVLALDIVPWRSWEIVSSDCPGYCIDYAVDEDHHGVNPPYISCAGSVTDLDHWERPLFVASFQRALGVAQRMGFDIQHAEYNVESIGSDICVDSRFIVSLMRSVGFEFLNYDGTTDKALGVDLEYDNTVKLDGSDDEWIAQSMVFHKVE